MTKQQFIDAVSAEQESLRRFLRGLCAGDGFLADDLAQEALLKAYLSFERFEGHSRFSTWLFRIAYNSYFDHLRKSGREDGWQSLDESPKEAGNVEDEPSIDRKYEHQQLYMAIRQLTVREQAVILLFYMEEKSIKEIMDILGMPSGTVRSCLSRGRQHLKQYLLRSI
ncbi:MAG: RNA polymerase sigma factor [Bacteroidales bacterium]|nr:RNA polymerase sigma factor [Bacteroidales bacterium]